MLLVQVVTKANGLLDTKPLTCDSDLLVYSTPLMVPLVPTVASGHITVTPLLCK
jgi:hypothetical protein